MMDQPTASDLFDWVGLNTAQVELSPEQVNRATQLSQSIRSTQQRWQVYLSALGTQGFEQWLSERAPDLSVRSESASIWQPNVANLMSTACNLRVGAFKVCVITTGSSMTNAVEVSIAALNLPDYAAHFYVLMQVLEEENQAAVTGFFTYDQVRQVSLHADSDWTCSVPIEWFNPDANALLLNLRCLEPNSIRLPALEYRSTAALREKLATLKPQLQTQPAWELLNPEEGLMLLSDPTLVNSLSATPLRDSINVRSWLRDCVDDAAQELGWRLMSSSILSGMRSMREDFDSIRSTLEHQGIEIPAAARGAYRDLRSDQGNVRLYAVTWILPETTPQPEWMLLVALGAVPEMPLPEHLKLEVRDETQLLVEQSLETNTADSNTRQTVLYAQVIGAWEEKFWVTVRANESRVFEIPPFSFELDEATPS